MHGEERCCQPGRNRCRSPSTPTPVQASTLLSLWLGSLSILPASPLLNHPCFRNTYFPNKKVY